jgi:hypothetical protein
MRHYGNGVADDEFFYLSADRGDHARRLGAVARGYRRLQRMSAAPVNQVGSIQANSLDANLYVMRTGCDDGHILYTLNLCGSRLIKQDNLGHAGRSMLRI